MATSEGKGTAADATVETQPAEGETSEFDRLQHEIDGEVLADNVERAKAKIAQLEEHVEGARESLENAEAELKAFKAAEKGEA